MELHLLKLSLTEQDLNDFLRKHLPPDAGVEDVRVQISPQGITVTGTYPFFISVRFETLWEVSIENGQGVARLASLKAMGVPGNIFKSAVVKMVEDAARKENWIRISGDRFIADVELAFAKYAFAARLHLKSVTLQPGLILVEAGH
jgi:hypothetical protein